MSGFGTYNQNNTSSTGTGAAYDPFKYGDAFYGSSFLLDYGMKGTPAVPTASFGGGVGPNREGSPGVAGTPPTTAVVSDWVNNFGSLSAAEIEAWQKGLFGAGFKVKPTGVTDPATRYALEEAIRESQQMGLTLQDLLARRAAAQAAFLKAGGGGGGAGRAPFVAPAFQPMSEATADTLVEQGAQATVGRSATGKEELTAEKKIRGVEKQAYSQQVGAAKAAYNNKAGTATQFTSADYQQAVNQTEQQAAPVEATGVELRTALKGFMDAVSAR